MGLWESFKQVAGNAVSAVGNAAAAVATKVVLPAVTSPLAVVDVVAGTNIQTTVNTTVVNVAKTVGGTVGGVAQSIGYNLGIAERPEDPGLKDKVDFWKKAGYDTSLFEGANAHGIDREALKMDKSWLKAAAAVYEMGGAIRLTGGLGGVNLTPQELAAIKEGKIDGIDPAKLKGLGDWGMGAMSMFNYNFTATAGASAQLLASGTPAQKQAYLFMMDAYEHQNTSLAGWLAAGKGMVTDPTTYVGIATFGVGLAAKEAAKEGGKLALREAIRAGAKQVLARGAVIGAMEGSINAGATDVITQSIKISAKRQNSFSVQELFTASATGAVASAVMVKGVTVAGKSVVRVLGRNADNAGGRIADDAGVETAEDVAGGAISTLPERVPSRGDTRSPTGGGSYFDRDGKRVTPGMGGRGRGGVSATGSGRQAWETKNAGGHSGGLPPGAGTRPAGAVSPGDTVRIDIPAGKTPQQAVDRWLLNQGDEAAATWRNLDPARRRAILDMVEDGEDIAWPANPGSRGGKPSAAAGAASDAADGASPTSPGGGANGTPFDRSPPAAPASGLPKIDLPEFKPGRDWMKWAAHRNFNPLTGFTSVLNRIPYKAFMVRSFGVTKPVIKAFDKELSELGINKGLKELQEKMLEAHAAGRDVTSLIDDFARNNHAQLDHMRASLKQLREHVDKTYEVNNVSTKKYGLSDGGNHTANQKGALLSYIDHLDDLAYDLQQGSRGQSGREMLDTLNQVKGRKFTYDDIRNSVTGLSRANALAIDSDIRLTGKWPNGQKAPVQWRESLQRSIDVGYVNTEPHTGKPLGIGFLSEENFEQHWQNKLLAFAERKEDGSLKSDFIGQVEPKRFFADALVQFYKGGYGHEAVFAIEQLRRMRQVWGKADSDTLPMADTLMELLRAKPEYKSDPGFAKWADHLNELLLRENKGAAKKDWFGLKARYFDDNRPNEHRAMNRMYFMEYATRWRGTNWISTPGGIYLNNRYLLGPLKRMAAYFLGAKEVKLEKTLQFGQETKDWGKATVNWTGAAEKPTFGQYVSIVPRALLRIGTAGLVRDFDIKAPQNILSRKGAFGLSSGLLALGGFATWGIGSLTGQETVANAGDAAYEWATLPMRTMWNSILGTGGETPETPAAPTAAAPNNGAAPAGDQSATGATAPTGNQSATSTEKLSLDEQFACASEAQKAELDKMYDDIDSLAAQFGDASDQVRAKTREVEQARINICLKAGKTPAQLGL